MTDFKAGEVCSVCIDDKEVHTVKVLAVTRLGVFIEIQDRAYDNEIYVKRSQITKVDKAKKDTVSDQLLEKWKQQALAFAYDTEDSRVSLKQVFSFIEENYKLVKRNK